MSDGSAPKLRDSKPGKLTEKIAEINQSFRERDIKQTAKKAGKSYIDLKIIPITHDALQLTSWEEVKKNQCIPFMMNDRKVSIACVDTAGSGSQQFLKKIQDLGYQLDVFQCSPEGIASTRKLFDQFKKQYKEAKISTTIEENESTPTDALQLFKSDDALFTSGTGPEMLNDLNLKAIQFRASDVHCQPEEAGIAIRMRRDGALYKVAELSVQQYRLLSGEIKRTAHIKINVTATPQDGEYDFEVNERLITVRVSTLPSKYGESIVMRILDKKQAITTLKEMGFATQQRELIEAALKRQRGLILVTGPTGSGKSSTLYSCLEFTNTPDKKIITLENPVEYKLANIVQCEINEAEDFTFSEGLRSILRHDPDIIMVGEIREKDSAEIALQASLTGHLVLSTLHTNSAIGAIPRLLNMGVKPFILSSGLELVIAQRLLRKLCDHCKQPVPYDVAQYPAIKSLVEGLKVKQVQVPTPQLFQPGKCEKCAQTGYEGRLMVAEMLPMSQQLKQLVASEAGSDQLEKLAEEQGFWSLAEITVLRVFNGETSLDELWKVMV